MDLFEVMERFPDQASCIEYLEDIRWKDSPQCPHCESESVYKRTHETETGRIGRWNCQNCKATFKVTCGTVFEGTKIALQKWFVAIVLIMNAKKSLSSHQLGRDLKLNQKSAWYIMTRVRTEMAEKVNAIILQGIIEADETYMGGKPRKENKKEDREPAKRGRGTDKDPILGAAERKDDGKVVAQLTPKLTGRAILEFFTKRVDIDNSELMTDEYPGYRCLDDKMKHEIVNHQDQYVDGDKHTNTIEGFWALLKRAWYGSHHHYTTLFTPLYVAEACYKYNNRNTECRFTKFLKGSMN